LSVLGGFPGSSLKDWQDPGTEPREALLPAL
jgi:hypothetical protein